MVVKAFLLDGKSRWDQHDNICCITTCCFSEWAWGTWEGFCQGRLYFTDYFPPSQSYFFPDTVGVEEWEFPINLLLASWWLCFMILPCILLYSPPYPPKTNPSVIFCTLIIYSVPHLNENIHHQILNWTALQCYYHCLLLPFELQLNMEIRICRLPASLFYISVHIYIYIHSALCMVKWYSNFFNINSTSVILF